MNDNKKNVSPEKLKEAMGIMASSADEERSNDPWIKRYHNLGFDIVLVG